MASKENLYNIGKNLGRLAVAGAALYGGIVYMERENHRPDFSQDTAVRGQVLTEKEITQLRNYESLMAKSSKVEPTPTFVPIPSVEPKLQVLHIVEKLPLPQMTAEGAQLIEKYKTELPDILVKINADLRQTEDLKMYYPIYRAAQDKTGVPWYLTWIVHEDESTASRNPNAFIPGAAHYGAMQRSVQFHPDSDVERASKDYGFLTDLAQRHPDDWREIIWGATALREYIDGAGSVSGGLRRYSAAGPAQERYREYENYQSILGN